jgi:microsomal dipeptidase-like Zn-dependent dipeptidase
MATADELHRSAPVVDLHVHAPDFVPQPFRRLYHLSGPRRPRDTGFDVLARAGVDVAVATAVGDPIVTRWYLRRSPWEAVEEQLSLVERGAARHGVAIARSAAAMERAGVEHRPAVVLGVEGGDALGDDVERVDAWHERGVRLVVPVHLADNQLGTTCLPWQQYAGPLPVRRRTEAGLSALGRRMVRRMQQVGILVDASHADSATLRGIIDVAEAPVVSSHSGARSVQDFSRYLSDDELRLIAATGGVIGLWPYRALRKGVRDMDELMAHARHVADLVGPEHLCLGTDMNGVPGVMAGYRGEEDLPGLTAALLDSGFGEDEVRGIVGGNALRVLRAVER